MGTSPGHLQLPGNTLWAAEHRSLASEEIHLLLLTRRVPTTAGGPDALITTWTRWSYVFLFPPPATAVIPTVSRRLRDFRGSLADHPAVESSALVSATPAVVPLSSSPQPELHSGPWIPAVGYVLRLSCLEVLQACLRSSLHPPVAEDVLAGYRPSTIRQYQSAWKALQNFLRNRPVTNISLPVILEFLSYMFHSRRRAAPTFTTYAAALADPLCLGFHLDFRGRLWDLMKRGFFLQRPPRQRIIFWS